MTQGSKRHVIIDYGDPDLREAFSGPAPDFILNDTHIFDPAPVWSFPEELYEKGGREKLEVGTANIVMSVYQARQRKLLKYTPSFQGYIRTCSDRWSEDRLIAAYDSKEAAKAAKKAAAEK